MGCINFLAGWGGNQLHDKIRCAQKKRAENVNADVDEGVRSFNDSTVALVDCYDAVRPTVESMPRHYHQNSVCHAHY